MSKSSKSVAHFKKRSMPRSAYGSLYGRVDWKDERSGQCGGSLSAGERRMSVTEITRVELLPLDRDRLAGFFIDAPASAVLDAYEFVCAGWVLGKTAPALGVELAGNDGAVRRLPTGYPRPDVSVCYPGAADAAFAGWWSPVSVLGVNAEFELHVQAVLKDDPRPVPLYGSIAPRRA
jgi:hypothetical protein